MYTREKPCRSDENQNHKGDRNPPPSFSSTLLDEIYRSIDGNVEKSGEKNLRRKSSYEEIAIASSRRVEKWMMEKDAIEKAAAKKRQQELDNEFIFFSSTSSSSDSSGALSSSDTEFFGSTRSKPKVSCFATRPKPVRTGTRSEQRKDNRFSPDDDRDRDRRRDDLIKSKSRALKIYANLKKVKQPISPGGRLTTFINSLFSNAAGSGKKTSSRNHEVGPSKACSSASSFSRSCLSKYSPRSREKMRTGDQRTVRFEPDSVVMDGDLRHKSVYHGESARFARPPLPPTALPEQKKFEPVTHNSQRSDHNNAFYNVDEDEDHDYLSDSSSDLFELDHLELYGSNNRYNEELPVYETTHFDTNRAIASGLIR